MAETILTSDKPSSSSALNPPSRIICHVCQKQFSQHTCPLCNLRYCSLQCNQSHSRRCTESFMRDNVVEEIRHMQSDDKTKRKMLDILKRFHMEEEMDSMDEDDSTESSQSTLSEETMQKILSDEKKLFLSAVASGELNKMIEPWDPWWLKPSARMISLSKQGTQLAQPFAQHDSSAPPENDVESNQSSEIPAGPKTPLPPISKLSSTKPSSLLVVHLVDIIYSYCFTIRLYNGDWQSAATRSIMMVLSVSSVLGQGGQPESVQEALSYCLEQICTSYRDMGGLHLALTVIDDIISLLSLGRSALFCALCDLQRLIQAGERELKLEKTKKPRKVEITTMLKSAERKIYFIMCWVHEQPGEVWSFAIAILRVEKNSYLDYEGGKSCVKREDKIESRSKVLIELSMEKQNSDAIHNCVIKLRMNPKKRRDKVYVGCGAGFGADRPMAALKLLHRVKQLNYLVLECLAERTLADRFQATLSGGDGYDSRISEWMRLLLPLAVERGTCIITNMGAMDPPGAQEKVLEVATSLGLNLSVVVAQEISVIFKPN